MGGLEGQGTGHGTSIESRNGGNGTDGTHPFRGVLSVPLEKRW
jgi:hypothetical protein